MSQLSEQILKIQTRCEHCGTIWQFENIDNVAEKSIDHHYKSGECQQNKERNTRSTGRYVGSGYWWGQTSSGTTSFNQPTWTNPPRGQWYYL